MYKSDKHIISIVTHGTGEIGICILNRQKVTIKQYFIHISLKDPWYAPHREKKFNGKMVLYGWMYFYFGVTTHQ